MEYLFSVLFFSANTAIVLFLFIMGAYGLWLMIAYCRHRGPDPVPERMFAEGRLPMVTVQLPVFNEGTLAEQILLAAAGLDYPADRLEIQFLDDSNDGTTTRIALDTIEKLRDERPDLRITYQHRTNRSHFKAGALLQATPSARGEFIAIFDADFHIPRDYLQRTIHFFNDEGVGAVQARWDYTNADASLFTRLQAAKLDLHQMAEQTGRAKIGLVPIFHGTAGIWRASTLEAAGGWNVKSEVEDAELTIRAAMNGQRIVYLDEMRILSELPESLTGFVRQQMRWKRGWVRLATLYTGFLLKGDARLRWRIDLLQRIHLSWGPALALVMMLSVLPYFMVASRLGLTIPATILYVASFILALVTRQYENKMLRGDPLSRGPLPMRRPFRIAPVGYLFMMGLLWIFFQATIEGFGRGQKWEVTPKKGGNNDQNRTLGLWPLYLSGTMATALVGGLLALLSIHYGHYLAAPFYGALAAGSLGVGLMLLRERNGGGWVDRPLVRLHDLFVAKSAAHPAE